MVVSDRCDVVTGRVGDAQYFQFRELHHFRPKSIIDVLRGRTMGVVFRGVIPERTCTLLAERFWASSARRARGMDAPGYYLGAYHYNKTTDDYLTETAELRHAVDAVLDVPDDPLIKLTQGLSDELAAEGVNFRLASHGGREAGRAILRSWHGQSEYALAPHEDLGQCTEPKQEGFEIQRAAQYQIVAMNMCLDNGAGGRLAIWNIRPDRASRFRFGLQYTGSPYPLGSLAGIEMTWLDVHPGDVYLFNGAHVHAVEPAIGVENQRLTLSGILGFIDEKTVVSWT